MATTNASPAPRADECPWACSTCSTHHENACPATWGGILTPAPCGHTPAPTSPPTRNIQPTRTVLRSLMDSGMRRDEAVKHLHRQVERGVWRLDGRFNVEMPTAHSSPLEGRPDE